jgi:NTP pyrophosphatase (non-canonical NTP hydrolase)
MTIEEYQVWTNSTARYPGSYVYSTEALETTNDHNPYTATFPFYLCLGLAGETGEVIEILKKFWRRQTTELNQEENDKLKLELGDVLWYWMQIATAAGLTVNEIMEANVGKLTTRINQRYF